MGASIKVSFRHSEETIRALTAMQLRLSGGSRGSRIVYTLGVLGLIAGTILSLEGYHAALVLVLLGCWAIMGAQQTANRTAKQIIKALRGKLPNVTYTFNEDGFDAQFDKTVDSYRYEDVSGLIRDKSFLYIYLKSKVTLVLPKNAGEHPEELSSFLENKAGRPWTSRLRRTGLLRTNIYALRDMVKNRRG